MCGAQTDSTLKTDTIESNSEEVITTVSRMLGDITSAIAGVFDSIYHVLNYLILVPVSHCFDQLL